MRSVSPAGHTMFIYIYNIQSDRDKFHLHHWWQLRLHNLINLRCHFPSAAASAPDTPSHSCVYNLDWSTESYCMQIEFL